MAGGINPGFISNLSDMAANAQKQADLANSDAYANDILKILNDYNTPGSQLTPDDVKKLKDLYAKLLEIEKRGDANLSDTATSILGWVQTLNIPCDNGKIRTLADLLTDPSLKPDDVAKWLDQGSSGFPPL